MAAVDAGADAVGFNLFPESARYVEPAVCAELVAATPGFVTTVGLVVNPEPADVENIRSLGLDLLQFHGDEDEAFCQRYGGPYIKAIRVASTADIEDQAYNFPSARGLLLDARVEGEWGGTGQRFDWQLAADLPARVILAGGLTPENVGEAIRIARPWAVDLSSGIESSPGIKDSTKMKAFAAAVFAADEVFRK